MSKCLELGSSMTGSTNSGHLQPQKDSYDFSAVLESPTRRDHRQRHCRKMTLPSSNEQPIQLTPLWEHVVLTRKFPSEMNTRLTFLEISERLRDPEWEVRQHALRVLVDVLPTLSTDTVDKLMQPVVPELVNNLGHSAPAVRKGALDAFRVFLVHSQDRETVIKSILQGSLQHIELRNPSEIEVITGIILSVPSLLFPSSKNSLPNPRLIKDAIIALALRLAQVPHQEAVLKSLIKIRDTVGVKEFESYLKDYDKKLKENIDVLAEIYNVKTNQRFEMVEAKRGSDSDTSGIVEEEDEQGKDSMSTARVVLETEIKFNEETAITMTILEEKHSEEEMEEDRGLTNVRKKSVKRVHFGGEVVKLRTPDSDNTELTEATTKTRIPLLATSLATISNSQPRPSSQPSSSQGRVQRPERNSCPISSSPKKDIYMHNANLSPKKSILIRNDLNLKASISDAKVEEQKRSVRNSEVVKIDSKHVQDDMKRNTGGLNVIKSDRKNKSKEWTEHAADYFFGVQLNNMETDEHFGPNTNETKNDYATMLMDFGTLKCNSQCVSKKNENALCSDGVKTEPLTVEPSWEELGLVDKNVLDDLHNKENWRAQVRGLERVASALSTTSALIAIESGLGSLLQEMLASQRSCRVAAAGMAVAKVVVTGVRVEALKKQLPQLACGLAKQGGPSAAQLARIAMLRVRPALLLEQLLQPQCIDAKNAKTRENTLQLLIFSLVTFPSSEFKVDVIAEKVAEMVRDQRRRVRQAALDTLAVLAQIYEPREVLAAGKRASEGYHDGETMISAIRTRLARKSLPLVSADGLVMYGLQISPTVQIVSGPDVDWIVAGSGSISSGIGRSKNLVIASRRRDGHTWRKSWGQRRSKDMQRENELRIQATQTVNAGRSLNSVLEKRSVSKVPVSIVESTNYGNIVEARFQKKNREENLPMKFLDSNSRVYGKFGEKDRSWYQPRSSSTETRQSSLSWNSNQQTFVIQNVFNLPLQREYHDYRRRDLTRKTGKTSDKSTSLVGQTGEHFPAIAPSETLYRRRLRSLSPSQLYRRQRFPSISAGQVHALSMYGIYCTWPEEANEGSDTVEKEDKYKNRSGDSRRREYKVANTIFRYCPCVFRCRQPVDIDDDFANAGPTPMIPVRSNRSSQTIEKTGNEGKRDEKNHHHFLPDDNFGDSVVAPLYGSDRGISSSDELENNGQHLPEDVGDKSDSESSSLERQNADAAFNVISAGSYSRSQDTFDFIISLGDKIDADTTTASTTTDVERSKKWSHDKEAQPQAENRLVLRGSSNTNFPGRNQSESEVSASDEVERVDERSITFATDTSQEASEDGEVLDSQVEETPSLKKFDNSGKFSRSLSMDIVEFEGSSFSRSSSPKMIFKVDNQASTDLNEERIASSAPRRDIESVHSRESSRSHGESARDESSAILSRHHSCIDIFHYTENNVEAMVQEVTEHDTDLTAPNSTSFQLTTESLVNRDVEAEWNDRPDLGILKAEIKIQEPALDRKRRPSRVPRVIGRSASGGTSEKIKPTINQCFTQLESKDWEIILKGLKTLSYIIKQMPECVEATAMVTISRLLGRHIKSLRSQVARVACSTAGDIFSSKIRGIDQELDDMVGPLLHRTADTNRFLRADSNTALDSMIEHIPPLKTVAVIIQHGASHQNAIVRAATARLLASVVDRVGAEYTLILQKDVRDKLLLTSARLLTDGNLDARKHAKRIFRRLMHCEGFRRALTDAVPEATLRHIDKTLRTLEHS